MVWLSLAVACGKIPDEAADGGDDDVTEPCERTDLSVDEFFDCYIEHQCPIQVNCFASFPDVETCVAEAPTSSGLAASFQRLKDSIAAGRVVFDATTGAACLAQIDEIAASGACQLELDACNTIFVGQVEAGGTCFEQNDCATIGSYCVEGDCQEQCCAGSCVSPVAVGSACGNDVPCAADEICDYTPVEGMERTCLSGDTGSACGDDGDCDRELYCSGGACVGDVGADAACTSDRQCVDPLLCVGKNLQAGRCKLTDDAGDDCDTACRGRNLYCDTTGSTGGTTGKCTALPDQAGDSCAASRECADPIFCNSTTQICEEPAQQGQSCTPYNCADPFFCSAEIDNTESGTCQAAQPAGRSCSRRNHCASSICAVAPGGTTRTCLNYEVCE